MPFPRIRLRDLVWIVLALLILWGLYSLSAVLTPFFLAAILAYIWQPVAHWLHRNHVPISLAVLFVMVLEALVLTLLVLSVLPLFIKEISQLVRELPALVDRINERVAPWIQAKTGVSVTMDSQSVMDWVISLVQADGFSGQVLNSLRLGGLGLLGVFATAVLVPVVQFYLMRDWRLIRMRFDTLIPRDWHDTVMQFFAEADDALAQYLHGQVLVILVMCVYYTLGLYFTGLEFFLPIGIITGVLVFVPYVGAATGFLLATLAAVMQFPSWGGLIWVWVVFGIGQALEGNFITPKLVGQRIGLHPVAVIFALLAFGQIFGFAGLLIALPASAVLLVGLRKLRAQYLASPFYNGRR
ncbi:MAG TPA: AI-2E family transporter [Burkholderiales bacterium]|nr:AI-2E family transporter [Burkholderiales bacterium]